MNVGGDITQLTYKELQALALRYHIPGNVKKKALIKVLQAARSGNEAEFSRLLQELRRSRKRKTKKSKDSRLGITSTPLHSPDYMMADEDYYCQQQQQQSQQQPPYQWIGAEEEIVSKDDDTKIPHYEEFKQFLLKRIQREFQACDTNNNQVQDLSIVDLRTTPMSTNLQTVPLNESNYSKANSINHVDPLAISSSDRPNYDILKESENSSQGSFLLKRMLQAPVGANLGEIASSLFWASNLLDNSDTLTAESENNENEDQLETNTNEYYSLLKNTRGEFMLNEANLMSQQIPNAGNDQYRFSGDVNNRPNPYQNWTINSVMEMPDTDLQSSKVYHTIYYNNTEPTVTTANTENNLTYQYQTDTGAYNGNQNFFNFDAQDANYIATNTSTDMIVNDPNDIYYLQNFGKHNGEMGTSYFRNVDTFGQNNTLQNTCENDQQYQYHYPRFIQETNNTLNERLDQQQSNVTGMENGVNHEIDAANMQRPANGAIESFRPKWTETDNNLENILNYQVPKQVDYSKLSQTSCVYCYVAPIVSQRSTLTNNGHCLIEHRRRYTAEQRQHSFSPYWMLYNDASQGMRMTNLSSDSFVQHDTTTTMHTTISSNDILKEIVGDVPEVPINDVWMNQYESSSIGDDMTAPISDSLFCNDISSAPTKT